MAADSHVIAIQAHALTQKVNVGGLRIETDRCWPAWSRYRTADNAINQSVSAPKRWTAVLITDELNRVSFLSDVPATLHAKARWSSLSRCWRASLKALVEYD